MKKFKRLILRLGLIFVILGIITISVTYLVIAPDLPDVESLRDVQLQVPLRVYIEDLKLISVFGEKRRFPVRFE